VRRPSRAAQETFEAEPEDVPEPEAYDDGEEGDEEGEGDDDEEERKSTREAAKAAAAEALAAAGVAAGEGPPRCLGGPGEWAFLAVVRQPGALTGQLYRWEVTGEAWWAAVGWSM
jgi:hypothetical protein